MHRKKPGKYRVIKNRMMDLIKEENLSVNQAKLVVELLEREIKAEAGRLKFQQ